MASRFGFGFGGGFKSSGGKNGPIIQNAGGPSNGEGDPGWETIKQTETKEKSLEEKLCEELISMDILDYDSAEEENEEAVLLSSVKEGAFLDVMVSVVESHEVFYAQPLQLNKFVTNLQVRINTYYDKGKTAMKTLSKISGMPTEAPDSLNYLKIALSFVTDSNGQKPKIFCATVFEDQFFYRAQIRRRISPCQVEVFFIDYGNTGVVPYGQLFELPDEFRKLPPACVKCRMLNAIPECIPLTFLRDHMEGKPLVLKLEEIKDEEYGVSVFLVEEEKDEVDYRERVIGDWKLKEGVEE